MSHKCHKCKEDCNHYSWDANQVLIDQLSKKASIGPCQILEFFGVVANFQSIGKTLKLKGINYDTTMVIVVILVVSRATHILVHPKRVIALEVSGFVFSGVNITIGKRLVVLIIEQYMNSNIQMGSSSVVMKTLVLTTGFLDMDF